jgi:two-component system, NtrC family, response regulator HydG
MSKDKRTLRAMVVDDKIELCETVVDGLSNHRIECVAVTSAIEALARWESERFDVLITDLRMPGMDGIELLSRAKQIAPTKPVIVMTAYGDVDTAIESIRGGAFHYLTKPFKIEELAIYVRRAVDDAAVRRDVGVLRRTFSEAASRANLIGKSEAMQRVFAILDRVASSSIPVLLTGPTGCGKGLIARAMHNESSRADAAFVTINCAALPEALLESELFGHVKGAFTGAASQKSGLFAEAEDGTLFLDEIGEMTPALQSKLLDALERGVVRPVGATKERPINVRVITATHRNLRELVAAGKFREDLLYRLDVLTIEVPPLRQRREDIAPLIEHFIKASRTRHPNSPVQFLSEAALDRMRKYVWPGNVRELAHTVERLVLLGSNEEIQPEDLSIALRDSPQSQYVFGGDITPLREMQQRYVSWAFREMGGHRGKTAEKLGVDMKTLARYLSEESSS